MVLWFLLKEDWQLLCVLTVDQKEYIYKHFKSDFLRAKLNIF